ncbi:MULTISPECIES: mechanosensitive ion channel domain-containing protein [Deefgea]|uniref:Mechanosensitive ion channel n=1 Tax=Deefgea chitinilytica TaxID=570276 RepID=A0ABS2C9L3_9NEIS|nr:MULTISPECIES: mechanosensitive ion channel domain-containing protein [Deefgea]MBM5570840.1 mechanosensitive ion channel [Deefgea chitinilytica]MBM9888069.1 mechanosensitive ion channel [Deefgea sp. CFH1-16]
MLENLSQQFPFLLDRGLLRDLALSILLIIAMLTLRAGMRKAILLREDFSLETKRRWLVTLRNSILITTVLGAVLIWGQEIQTFAVSLVAVAAAFVLATKEVILCMLGSIYRTSTRLYELGDRIEIAGIKGQVIDVNLISTTLIESSRAEHHKGTVGRGIKIPNSMLFTNPVYNETMMGHFAIQTIHIHIERDADWELAETILLECGRETIAEYCKELVSHAKEIASDYIIDTPLQEPRVRIILDDIDSIALQLQLPAPLGLRAKIEQRILRQFLREFKQRQANQHDIDQ